MISYILLYSLGVSVLFALLVFLRKFFHKESFSSFQFQFTKKGYFVFNFDRPIHYTLIYVPLVLIYTMVGAFHLLVSDVVLGIFNVSIIGCALAILVVRKNTLMIGTGLCYNFLFIINLYVFVKEGKPNEYFGK